MPTFSVLVTADVTVSREITVEAENEDQAEGLALEAARNSNYSDHKWCLDDANGFVPYIGDPGNSATLLPDLRIGDNVEGGEGENYDRGTIIAFIDPPRDGNDVLVAWEGGGGFQATAASARLRSLE